MRVAVNLSDIHFAQFDIVATVAAALDESGLDPTCLEIELTESVGMRDVERTITTLHQLNALGVQLSVDDFGGRLFKPSLLEAFSDQLLKIS